MTQRKFPPLGPTHPLVGRVCPACEVTFADGDETTLVILGPGGDPDARERRDQGRAYNAVGQAVHWDCAEQR